MPATRKQKQTNLAEIVSLMFVMGRFMRDKMQKSGNNEYCNSLLDFETLRYIKDNERPYMKDVAKNFHVTPPAATLLIDNLVKEKLLIRLIDPQDRRSVRLGLTKKGSELFEKSMIQKAVQFKKIFGVLTPAERTQFALLLKKIINNNT
jgi:DNA-binding MarR family transcriptional regulator